MYWFRNSHVSIVFLFVSRYVCKIKNRILCCFPLLSFHLSIGHVLGDKFVSVLLNPHSFNACLKDATHNMAATHKSDAASTLESLVFILALCS